MGILLKTRSILPGFNLSLGISVFCLSLLVIFPFIMLVLTATEMTWASFVDTITTPRVLAALWVTLRISFYAMLTNLVFGLILAWVIVRYRFPGRNLLNALVDLPFALPTAVTGITLATLYSPNGIFGQVFGATGFIGQWFGGIKIAFTPIGIWLALVVVSLPFIVRAVQPILEQMQPDLEEAATTLGANRFTIFRRVILAELMPAIVMGAGMMFARATGEYGSVIFIAGNIPYQSEILPLIITGKLEQFDMQGAAAVALFMLVISFAILLLFNVIQWRLNKRISHNL